MKPRVILLGILAIILGLLLPAILSAQRGNIIIPPGASITVPLNAQICADTIFANGPGYGTLTIADPSCLCPGTVVTPVELLSFSATLQNGVTLLTWLTATEMRNYGFEVQRKTEADSWTTLGFVLGHGSTAQRQFYLYTDDLQDLPAYCSHLSYRLKQIDFDGSFEYSPVVSVELGSTPQSFALLTPYPNPAQDHLFIPFTVPKEGAVTIRLYNVAGQVLLNVYESVRFRGGSHTVTANISGVPAGMYFIELTAGERKQHRRVSITR